MVCAAILVMKSVVLAPVSSLMKIPLIVVPSALVLSAILALNVKVTVPLVSTFTFVMLPKFAVMTPKLTFELAGQKHGTATDTKYLTGTVTGEGVKSPKIGFETFVTKYNRYGEESKPDVTVYNTAGQMTAEELEQVVRKSDIANAFRRALKEVKEQYKANPDYVTVWNLES